MEFDGTADILGNNFLLGKSLDITEWNEHNSNSVKELGKWYIGAMQILGDKLKYKGSIKGTLQVSFYKSFAM